MQTAVFYFHSELDFFLPRQSKGKPLPLTFDDHQSVKHLVESLGVPHVEVGMIRVNDDEVGFNYLPRNGDQITILPPQSGSPENPRFAVDGHLGRLASYMRMLGFDTFYEKQIADSRLAGTAVTESRILLTRDRRLLMYKEILSGRCVRSLEPLEQLKEVIDKFDLSNKIIPFRRCLDCNGLLKSVKKQDVLENLQPLTKKYYDEFSICQDCHKVYWKGSHYDRMSNLVEACIGRHPTR